MKKKFLCLILALAMLLSLVACGNNNDTPSTPDPDPAPATPDDNANPAEPEGFQPYTYEESVVYEGALGEFYAALQAAKDDSVIDLDERVAMMAVAEAKLLESGVMMPVYSPGANYAIGRMAPRTVSSVMWGSDSDRLETTIVVNGDLPITTEQRNEMIELWANAPDGASYLAAAKEYLVGQGYELSDTYTMAYTGDPTTWDVLSTFQSMNSEPVCMTLDGLIKYDVKNIPQPALAESWEESEDGLTYTFHIRQGVKWVDSQGREVADVKADDWVSGMQHLCDVKGGAQELLTGVIKNAEAYCLGEITDFSQVGVEAVDDYTLVYTLEKPVPYFMTMLTYCGAYGPMSRTYYESQGGKYGADYDNTAASYTYGTSPNNIAYCGPYLVTNWTEKNTIVYRTNPTYWNPDGIMSANHVWVYSDGTDPLFTYNQFKAGVFAAAGLGTSALQQAQVDGLFEGYYYQAATSSTSYVGFCNLNRQAFANSNDPTVVVSNQSHASADEIDIINGVYSSEIEDDAARTHLALNNQAFRQALCFAFDRGSYNAQLVGENLKYARLRNSYVPGNFVLLGKDVTIDINGTPTTFAEGTYYGAIMQAQLDADNYPIKVWDPELEGGAGSGDGFDGIYNPDEAAKRLAVAVEELAALGCEVSPENPIYLDYPGQTWSEAGANSAQAYKQSIENALGGSVIINVMECQTSDEYRYATYLPETGSLMNFDMNFGTGWSADYGDPGNYLDTLLPEGAGYSAKNFGLW